MNERSEITQLPTDAKDSLIFDGGRVYQVTPTRLRIEFGTSWREMDFDQWVFWLRHDRVAEDRKMFAAMAMQGIFAHGGPLMPNESVEAAEYAVRAADALLKELAK